MKRRTAVGAIITMESKFLLINKISEHDIKSNKFQPSIDFIKGGVKEGETLIDALKREIKEEINITCDKYDIKCQVDEPLYFEFQDSPIYVDQLTWFFIIKINDSNIKFKPDASEVGGIYLLDYCEMLEKITFKETKDYILCISEKYNLF